jgi:hypothetical protein
MAPVGKMAPSICEKVILIDAQDHESSFGRMRAHLRNCVITMVIGFLVSAVAAGVLLFGPEFSDQAALFISFVLLVSVGLFLLASVALITPIVDYLTYERIQSLQRELDWLDEHEQRQQVFTVLCQAFSSDEPAEVAKAHSEEFVAYFGDVPIR